MTIKQIIQSGNPVIRNRSKNISIKEIKSVKIKTIIKKLVDSMRHHNLVGISAPQINYNLRIFVTKIRNTKNRKVEKLDTLKVFINPQILSLSVKKVSGYEGCGSIADANLFGLISRPHNVKIKAQDINGQWFELKASGLLSRVIQHEYDHLDGVLFVDKISNTKSYMSRSEYIKKKR